MWRARSPQLYKTHSRTWCLACQRSKMRKLGGCLLSLHNRVWTSLGPWRDPCPLCPVPRLLLTSLSLQFPFQGFPIYFTAQKSSQNWYCPRWGAGADGRPAEKGRETERCITPHLKEGQLGEDLSDLALLVPQVWALSLPLGSLAVPYSIEFILDQT